MSQSAKKLKQAQLPFKVCSPAMAQSPSGVKTPSALKKRPISREDLSGSKKQKSSTSESSDCGEVEVTSSSDGPRPVSPQRRARTPLDQFVTVQKPPPEVTTSSDVVDLTDENKENVVVLESGETAVPPSHQAPASDSNSANVEDVVSKTGVSQTVESSEGVEAKTVSGSDTNETTEVDDIVLLDDECEAKSSASNKDESKSPGAYIPQKSPGSLMAKKTPKQLQREAIRAKKEQERLAEKQRKEEERERLRKEKIEQKERERKEKEEKKEKERQEKENEKLEKQRQREAEKQQKEAEKATREEEKRRQKEEERQAKEEEKRKAEEEEQKKMAKAKMMFSSFFVKKPAEPEGEPEPVKEVISNAFQQFRVKEDMVLAPGARADLSVGQSSALDAAVSGAEPPAEDDKLYLQLLRSGAHRPQTRGRTLPPVQKDIEIIEDEEEEDSELANLGTGIVLSSAAANAKRKLRYKMLMFHENRRPAYWGTWSKRSSSVRPRRPLGKATILNYEEDSDEDWEEEDPNGESLSGSEKEVESDDEYDVDNEFFVPHGYLSDEEIKDEEEMVDPEARKAKLKQQGEEFDRQMKKKTTALKPRLIGCVWQQQDCADPVFQQLVKLLRPFAVRVFCALPVSTACSGEADGGGPEADPSPAATPASAKFLKQVPDEALLPLCQLVHGCRRSKALLVREFAVYWKRRVGALSPRKADPSTPADNATNTNADAGASPPAGQILSKRKIYDKLMQIAEYGRCAVEGPMLNHCCWQVKPEVLATLSETVPLPNQWKWITKVSSKKSLSTQTTAAGSQGGAETPVAATQKPRTGVPLITKFTKKVTAEEARRDLLSPPKAKRKIVPMQLSAPQTSGIPATSPAAQTALKPAAQGIGKFFRASPSAPADKAGPSTADSVRTPKRRVVLTPVGGRVTVTPRRLAPTPVPRLGPAATPVAGPGGWGQQPHTPAPRKVPLVTLSTTTSGSTGPDRAAPTVISVQRARELVAAQQTGARAREPATTGGCSANAEVETIILD